jgi:hypothetical protein
MADQVYLHVGTMKSATSYLQSLCQRNRGQLAKKNILWLPIGMQHRSVNAVVLRRVPRPMQPRDWRETVAQIREHSGTVLLSNETLAHRPARRIQRLLKQLRPADVQVVITARDLARVVPSFWQTTLRNQGEVPWRTYAEWVCSDAPPAEGRETADWFWERQDLGAIASTWIEQVGRDKVTLVTVPPPGSPTELTGSRFLSVVGVDASRFKPPAASNESLSLQSAELLRRLNARAGTVDNAENKRVIRKELVNNALAHVGRPDVTSTGSPSSAGSTGYGLDAEQRAWARARSQRMIASLADAKVRVVGDLADLVPDAAAPSSLQDPSDATSAELLDVALDALLRLAEGNAKEPPGSNPSA